MRPLTFARRIPGPPQFLPAERDPEPTDHQVASQLTQPSRPSTPERELISAIITSALKSLDMPTFKASMRKSKEGSLRLNAIAWVFGFVRNPRFSFDYCCYVLGSDTEAARKALVQRYRITEEEIADSNEPWCWSIYVDSIREYA